MSSISRRKQVYFDTHLVTQSDKISSILEAAGVDAEPIWATLLAKALEGKNVKDLLSNVGAGGGAPVAGGAPQQQRQVEQQRRQQRRRRKRRRRKSQTTTWYACIIT